MNQKMVNLYQYNTQTLKMIDYRELPEDGIKFEQLTREIFIRENYETYWTGIGPDGGRDLIIIEKLTGNLSNSERKWLVSCKHTANAGKNGRSVGINELGNPVADCQAIKAEGYILVCSTYPSSSVVNRLEEIENNQNIITKIWDGVEIEKRLLNPNTFGLIHTFFPKSSKDYKWKIYNEYSPSFWSAGFKDYFFYLSSRDANIYPNLKGIETIISLLERIDINKDKGRDSYEEHLLRPRSIHFDDKHSTHMVYLDYLMPFNTNKNSIVRPSAIRDMLLEHFTGEDHKYVNVPDLDIKYVETSFTSDHFHPDHKKHYETYIPNFKSGSPRGNLYFGYEF
tara:strand:- start:2236 stop:3252 length:1017 start_codon:yes stop_codon:yes gene_type:complete